MICRECGCGYMPDIPDDVAMHEEHHAWLSLKWASGPTDGVVFDRGGTRILAVTCDDRAELRHRAKGVSLRVTREMEFERVLDEYGMPIGIHFDGSNWAAHERHAFIAVANGEVSGLAILERLPWVASLIWGRPEGVPWNDAVGGQWTVAVVWTARGARGQGLARDLACSMAAFIGLEVKDLAWALPFSPAGRALVRRLSPCRLLVGGGP